jgi:GTPase
MANPLRGEVELQTPDKTYTMRMSINAIVSIEDHFDKGINQVSDMLADPSSMRIGHLRSIIMHTLREHHPEVDETTAGEIIGQAGFEATAEAIQKAMVAAFPQAKVATENPRKAK